MRSAAQEGLSTPQDEKRHRLTHAGFLTRLSGVRASLAQAQTFRDAPPADKIRRGHPPPSGRLYLHQLQ